jgi:lysozyme family protein
MATFEESFPVMMQHEGHKFTNIKGDPGGPTMWGVTLRSSQTDLTDFDINHDGIVSEQELKDATPAEIENYYKTKWWKPLYSSIMDQILATKIIDTAINVGVSSSIDFLQIALSELGYSLTIDGKFGQDTLRLTNLALARYGEDQIMDKFSEVQNEHYMNWCDANIDAREKFRNGLRNRAAWPKKALMEG